ncbi:transcription initiation factor IID, 31kD subunit-domain-containing protein [Papiliotrema laurentii]|uniref:Transcription initiation factor IID, 31kD subunit-domain-containing protein n=1 Tax=Papiliotrema laurentii TaxID=5418 RepID=A0AAD9FTV6_PAPLA|nr:transcription initiation factor IID, 31kD subunit-domain-containing protein [Papiliotrema laurentii]
MTNVQRPVPRDGRLISLILASKGIDDADERVIHQLLDFAHRYTADVLQAAQSLADHAGRSGPSRIEKDDVELAIQMRRRYEFFEPPPRDASYLASLAHELNSQPLPILPETFDLLRLPPPHQRLGEVNFNIVPDAELTFESEEDEDLTSESDEDEARTEDGADAFKGEEGEAEGEPEDEDMEEVDVDEPVVRQERQVDEDYDD